MTRRMEDSTGVPVTVEVIQAGADEVSSYRIAVPDRVPVGRADFIDLHGAENGRVFFHTEVDPAYSGRGLAGLLLAQALADSIEKQIVVVPVCPFFARHLRDHGEEFRAAGGTFRRPTAADIAAVRNATSLKRPRPVISEGGGNGP